MNGYVAGSETEIVSKRAVKNMSVRKSAKENAALAHPFLGMS